MNLRFLNQLDLPGDWPRVEPLLKKVVDKAVHGEYGLDDLRRMAYENRICIGVMEDAEGMPVLALAFEFIDYPSGKKAVNVLATGGSQIDALMTLFWGRFQDWARSQGCDWIECLVSPGMERIHQRYGLKTVYRQMRMVLDKEE